MKIQATHMIFGYPYVEITPGVFFGGGSRKAGPRYRPGTCVAITENAPLLDIDVQEIVSAYRYSKDRRFEALLAANPDWR